ncbi:hypothetical protein I5G60_gp79 [Mycobacterium phage Saguaro]|uniref:Uncharacterized protein n=1 Tax=Mycobacterium phage Saguaro TaxID=2315616 RepID=A0A386K9J9_9CAUD|nr:hypothetical protein I5G60_gp79 [Mycobacterium phage Saguaro]AYD82071.1 hypothetical protein SEA_SAGUARO_79 [Mycobacterium phage Saguaro]
MAEIICADELEIGDVYRHMVRGLALAEARGDAYRVTGARTVRSVETYRVLEVVSLRTGHPGQLSLLHESTVARLERQPLRDLKGYLDYMPNGESLHIVRADDAFWC